MHGKFAYLIMAHNNFCILERLLSLLDDERSDLYVHIDRKAAEVPFERLKAAVRKGTLVFIPRISVAWGGDSQIIVTMNLLKEAVKTPHSYYHFISGTDLPLQTQDAFHSFFDAHYGLEYMTITAGMNYEEIRDRVRYYYPFQNYIGRGSGKIVAAYYYAQQALLKIQKVLQVDRIKSSDLTLQKGSQWFSITQAFASYLVEHEKVVYKYFCRAMNADEVFVQTMLVNSKYKDNLADCYMRCIDWERGAPYTFRIDDFDMLMNSGMFFARKFDEKTDMEIVEKIYAVLSEKQ